MNLNKFNESEIPAGEIWLLIDSLKFGGIETHIRELATGLKRFNKPVRVVVLRRYDTPQLLVQSLIELNLPHSYLSDLTPDAEHLLKQLCLAVRRYRPALLHSHGYKASICSRLTKLITGVPQFSTFHAGETPTGKVWLYDWLDRHTSRFSSQAISVSDAIDAKLPVESLVMNNFITQPEPVQTPGKQIAFIGRLSEEKAPDRFLALAQQFTDHPFHLYGDGPMYADISKQAPGNLVLHGHIPNMQPYWHNIGLVVLPSRFEGLPMVSLEAMGRGIPVLATDVGALSSLIEHDTNGWIAQEPEQLSDLLQMWFSLSEQQKLAIGQSARSTIFASYTDQAVIPQLIRTYQQYAAC